MLMLAFLRAVSAESRGGRLYSFVRSRWLACSLCGFLLALMTIRAVAAEPKRVLVVHSFGNAAPPFTTASTAFETALTEEMGESVDLDEVSLDVARYATLDMEEALVELMRKRQARWQPDLVVPIGSPAGIFVAQYRDRLFPTRTPIIYTGMDQRRLPPDALHNATFIGASYDLPGAVEDILQVAPATTNIVVVIGATPLEQFWTDVLRREYQPLTNRVSFTWFNDLSFDQMLERSAKLPPHSFMLLILLMRDATGVTHNADEALRRIHEVANAPVNGLFKNQLGMGIVGGRLYADELEGIESARIAVRILRGEPAWSFPPQVVPPSRPQYDWRELERWNISENRLPAGSVVLFRELTIWERYTGRIVLLISALVAQGVMISLLLANRARRRRAEQSLRESGNRLQAILDTAVEGIITINERGIIESVNEATVRIFGYSAAEIIGRNVSMLLPSPFQQEHDQDLANHRRSRQPKNVGNGRELRGRRKDGSVFPIDLAISEIVLANRRIFTGFVRDVTERKEAERTAREFGGRLIRAQEAERARLARELHDDITQRLARLAIDAGCIEQGRAGVGPGEAMHGVRDGLVRLSEDVHSLSYKLHPALLADLGLADALKAECERFSRQESISVDVQLEKVPEGISPETGLCLFRVTQEALRNVARHARAEAAKVSLRQLDGGLQLAVSDSGIGFDPGQQRHRPSLGLASMRERVRLLDGELDVESASGHGTTIVAWVPLNEAKI
jgi:PAS domain S-box-containing protein